MGHSEKIQITSDTRCHLRYLTVAPDSCIDILWEKNQLQFLRLILVFINWASMLPVLIGSMTFITTVVFLQENIHTVHQEFHEYL